MIKVKGEVAMSYSKEVSREINAKVIRRLISMILIVVYVILFFRINQYKFGYYNFDMLFNDIENSYRNYRLTFDVMNVVHYTSNLVMMAIVCSVFLLVLSEVYWKNRKKMVYYIHMLVMNISVSLVVAHLIQYNLVWGVDIFKYKVFWVFMAYVVIGICIMIFDFIWIIKSKDDVYVSYKKINTLMVILNVAVILFIGLYFFLVLKEYNALFVYNNEQKKQGDNLVESVEYQMGNYSNKVGIYADGSIFIYGDLEELDDGKYKKVVYRIDEEGNYDEVLSYVDDLSFIPEMAYYDGYVYTYMYDEENEEHSCRLVRFCIDTGKEETIIICDDLIRYGIADNKLFYYLVYDWDKSVVVKYIDLDNVISRKEAVTYDTGIVADKLYSDYFIERILYNKKDIYTTRVEDNGHYRQFYKENIYNYSCNIEYDDGYDWDDEFKYEHSHVLFREEGKGEPKKVTTIETDVQRFNIFDEEIYYVKRVETGYELWKCSLIGGNKILIAEIPYDVVHTYNFEADIFCTGLIVGEQYAVCDFGEYIYRDYSVDERFIVDLETGELVEVEP